MIDRISELERALVLAQEEQNALRTALEETRHHGIEVEDAIRDASQLLHAQELPCTLSVTANDEDLDNWSDAKTSPSRSTNSEGRPTSSHSHSSSDVHRQNHDLRYKYTVLQDQLWSQDAGYRTSLSHKEVELNALRTRLHVTEKESQGHLQQLLSLKSSISSLTRSESQATDAALVDEFEQLANRIREWVITNFRKAKMDVHSGDLPSETVKALQALTVRYAEIESPNRLALYQALVTSAMMQIFDASVVAGLPKTGLLGTLCAFAQGKNDTSIEYREWRRATIRMVDVDRHLADALREGRDEVLHRIAKRIANLLYTLTCFSLSPHAQAALMSILQTAACLQRTLALQKARYWATFLRVTNEHSALKFDEQKMEAVNDTIEDDGDMMDQERQIFFSVFPSLEKSGDEWGEHVDVSNVLVKARVCCGVG